MPRQIKTYDDWLALSDEERDEIHHGIWDGYTRDGVCIAYMAAARLALQSERKVLEIQIGTYHGGEYLLHMTVSEEEFRDCPPMLTERFEGFRIVWLPSRPLQPALGVVGTLEGKWRAVRGDYEFDIRILETGVSVKGRVIATGEELQIMRVTVNDVFLLFSACEPGSSSVSNHVFSLVTSDGCRDDASRTEYYDRIS